MPIITKKGLPANEILRKENVQVLEDEKDYQNLEIIKIAILNLMPIKEDTELQLLRKLATANKNIKVIFFNVSSYIGKNTNPEHIEKFYSTFDEIKKENIDGLIITGAPVEQMQFEEVLYWEELTRIMEWAKTNVKSTFYICWGAQAGLYYNYGIDKMLLYDKMFGVFKHKILNDSDIVKGMENGFKVPHSRHTSVEREEIEKHPELTIVAESDDAGVFIVEDKERKQLFITGHSEYSKDTLDAEYKRDLDKGLRIKIPRNYYKNNNPENEIIFSWEDNGNKIYSNWVNYYLI